MFCCCSCGGSGKGGAATAELDCAVDGGGVVEPKMEFCCLLPCASDGSVEQVPKMDAAPVFLGDKDAGAKMEFCCSGMFCCCCGGKGGGAATAELDFAVDGGVVEPKMEFCCLLPCASDGGVEKVPKMDAVPFFGEPFVLGDDEDAGASVAVDVINAFFWGDVGVSVSAPGVVNTVGGVVDVSADDGSSLVGGVAVANVEEPTI